MKIVRQPEGSNLCGQACVAMVLDVGLETVCLWMRCRGKTTTRQLVRILREQGRQAGDRRVRVRAGEPLPGRAILCVRSRAKKTMRHWMVLWDGIIYDPALGADMPDWRAGGQAWDHYELTSYLELG